MPETYSKADVEAALTNVGFTIGPRVGALSLYQTNFSPGNDLVLDWSRGPLEWKDILGQLEFQGIDPDPIHTLLLNP